MCEKEEVSKYVLHFTNIIRTSKERVFVRCVACLRAEGKHYRLFHCLWQVNLSVSCNTLNQTFLVVCVNMAT